MGLIGPSEIERQILINQAAILTALAGLESREEILALMHEAAQNTAMLLEAPQQSDEWRLGYGKDGMSCRNCHHAKTLVIWKCQEHGGRQTQSYCKCKDWAGREAP